MIEGNGDDVKVTTIKSSGTNQNRYPEREAGEKTRGHGWYGTFEP
jgi:hypothetical protein